MEYKKETKNQRIKKHEGTIGSGKYIYIYIFFHIYFYYKKSNIIKNIKKFTYF